MSEEKKSRPGPDRLLNELERVEARLKEWIMKSRENAQLFSNDPLAAMKAAGLDIDDEIMLELERVIAEIARKLR